MSQVNRHSARFANEPASGDKSSVLDTPYSWVIAVLCSLMYFVMYGLARASGLLFVATLASLDTDRATASFPFTLACALRYMGGPLAGYLADQFGIRQVILFGCILSSVGVGACSMTDSLVTVAVMWGGLYGLGSSFSATQLPQMNNLYFRKYFTTANGLACAGAALSGIVLPPLTERLLDEYGIKGTYLILTGIALNSIPVAWLIKEPKKKITRHISLRGFTFEELNAPHTARRFSEDIVDYTKNAATNLQNGITQATLNIRRFSSACRDSGAVSLIENPRRRSAISNYVETRRVSMFSLGKRRNSCPTDLSDYNALPFKKGEINLAFIEEDDLEEMSHIEDNATNTRATTVTRRESMFSNNNNCKKDNVSINLSAYSHKTPRNSIYVIECPTGPIEYEINIKQSGWKVFDIFLDIRFLLICFSASINGYYCFVLPTILNDFALDKGISLEHSTYMLMVMSLVDLLGRVGLGWVTDTGLVSVTNFCAACFLLLAASLMFMVWTIDIVTMYVVLGLMGLSLGVHCSMPPGLVTMYIDPDRHTMANASLNVFSVPFLLLTSSMIGYFRDDLGSYDWFVYILSIISMICCFMMLILPYIGKQKDKTIKSKL